MYRGPGVHIHECTECGKPCITSWEPLISLVRAFDNENLFREQVRERPGKLPMFVVRKNLEFWPQIRNILALKSASLDRGCPKMADFFPSCRTLWPLLVDDLGTWIEGQSWPGQGRRRFVVLRRRGKNNGHDLIASQMALESASFGQSKLIFRRI
ncbi:hypothetical protein BDN72DRAFT_964146, partial [Pluteus cervinus]